MRHPHPFLWLPPAFALGCIVGCGGPEVNDTVPVGGTLLVAGVPAASARVAFHPAGGGPAACPVGLTGPDGSFRLTTHTAGDGAPAGEYVVTVVWPNDSLPVDECDTPVHDRLNGLYASAAKSSLRATVRPGRNEIVLRAEVGATGWNLPRLQDSGRMSAPTPPGERGRAR